MKFDVPEKEILLAKKPHDLFLVNLIANHILAFVATLGFASSWPWTMLMVPVVSLIILGYTVIRAKRSLKHDPWFVKCHWQLTLKRSKILIIMIVIGSLTVTTGVILYTYFDVMKEATFALIGGIGLLPVMVTVLILIVMESDALHQAGNGELPKSIVDTFSKDQYQQIEKTIDYKD